MARVYVSSTVADLVLERRAVMDWLVAAGHQPHHSYRPDSESVRESCLEDIDGADLYVLILGHRYGSTPEDDNPESLSITHLEFRRAGHLGIPRIVLQRTSVPDIRLSDLLDPDRAARVRAFQGEVQREVRIAEFSTLDGLIQGLSTGVPNELDKLSRNRGPAKAGAAPDDPPVLPAAVTVFPINGMGMNVVRGVEDNEEPNGQFACYLALQITPNDRPVDLLALRAIYHACGCPALQGRPTLEIAGKPAQLMGDECTLVEPLRLPPAGISVRYGRELRPPLRSDSPADCDYGDVTVSITYRIPGAEEAHEEDRFYRFEPGGKLQKIAGIRPVPRLHDQELERCLALGRLDQEAFEALRALDPVDRYMGARSDTGENFVPAPHLLETLRQILRRPCQPDLFANAGGVSRPRAAEPPDPA